MSRQRERREFQAGLAEEVDAWLRGDTSKRTFLSRLVELGGAAALSRPGLALARQRGPPREVGAGRGRARRSQHAVRPGAGRRRQSLDRRPAGELGLSRGPGRQAVRGRNPQHDLRVRPAGARAPELLRTALAGPHRHRLQRRGAAAPGPVLQADRRAHRGLRRLRHPRHRAGLDSLARQWRRDPADRRLCRAAHEQGRSRGLPSPVPVPADLQGQALGLLRRRRRLRALLPHRHLRRSRSCSRRTRPSSIGTCACPRPGTNTPRSPSSSPISWRPTSTAPPISARRAARATSSPSCSSIAPTAASSSTSRRCRRSSIRRPASRPSGR